MDLDRRQWLATAVGAAAALVAGCGGGGGVDTGGTGAPTAFTLGTVTGFGSVIVKGVRFDDRGADVFDDDGIRRSRADLKLGMTTEIDSDPITPPTAGATLATATARSFRYASEMVGRVQAKTATSITVLGQTVRVTAGSTVFDASIVGGFAGIVVGNVVEVYARFDPATGTYEATRIERKGGTPGEFRLRGIVAGHDATNRRFRIGTQTIRYDDDTDLRSTPGNGRFVKLRLETTQPAANSWTATRIDAGDRGAPEDRDDARIEGFVTAVLSATRFRVDGILVDASNASEMPPAGSIVVGAEVEVEGALDAGVLVAEKVEIEDEDEDFEVEGPISALNAGARTFVVQGITVRWTDATVFEDGGEGDLAAGVDVDVHGTLTDGGTVLLAETIEIDD